LFRIFGSIRKEILGHSKTDRYVLCAAGELLLVMADCIRDRRVEEMDNAELFFNREFVGAATARPDSELPRLREYAREIRGLIEDEYRQERGSAL
jgi:hypothetical protein